MKVRETWQQTVKQQLTSKRNVFLSLLKQWSWKVCVTPSSVAVCWPEGSDSHGVWGWGLGSFVYCCLWCFLMTLHWCWCSCDIAELYKGALLILQIEENTIQRSSRGMGSGKVEAGIGISGGIHGDEWGSMKTEQAAYNCDYFGLKPLLKPF